MFEQPAPVSNFERHCGAAWLRAGTDQMPRRVSRDGGLDAGSSSDDERGFGARRAPFVEGRVSVLARCRPRDRRCARLAWRLAFYSVDLRDGALRVFRSDDERKSWRALELIGVRANLAKWESLIGHRHAVTPVAARDAVAPAEGSPPLARRSPSRLPGVAEEGSEGAPFLDAGGEGERDPPFCAAPARSYLTFEVWEGGVGGAPAPLLKFAADPTRRDDLDKLHDSLEAIAVSSQTHVVEP